METKIFKADIVNLTQHSATAEQRAAGVYDLNFALLEELKFNLTFNELPTQGVINKKANLIASLASREGVKYAMIGGAPYLMRPLEEALLKRGIHPLYSFSERVSEEKEINGEVIKTSTFKHKGFIKIYE